MIGDLVDFGQVIPLIAEFDQLASATRLIFRSEIFGGTWDALYDDRADLVIGAPNMPPPGDYFTRTIGSYDFVLVVAAGHPLAAEDKPLPPHVLRQHRAVAIGDTSRRLQPRTGGLLDGQDVLTVHSSLAKLDVILAGLGSGYLPRSMVGPYLASGIWWPRKWPRTVRTTRCALPGSRHSLARRCSGSFSVWSRRWKRANSGRETAGVREEAGWSCVPRADS
ncbi:LysR substrate-binding domain-containing protein [Chromobacterium haemolyticum]|nr:LysR substrate-binding domain-containing protein [Chromobacterium haemolyticum]